MRSLIRPTMVFSAVANINPEQFIKEYPEIKGISWDVDKTLTGQHDEEISVENLEVMRGFDELGILQGIASNAQSVERTRRVQRIAERCIGNKMHVVTSMMVEGKRKPKTPIFHELAEQMGLPSAKIAHVGDQLLKDVVGANRAGYAASILVAPYGEGDALGVRYLQRPLEAALRPLVGVPLLTRNFDKELYTTPVTKPIPVEGGA